MMVITNLETAVGLRPVNKGEIAIEMISGVDTGHIEDLSIHGEDLIVLEQQLARFE